MPSLNFYNSACGLDASEKLIAPTGQLPVQMFNTGHSYWAQSQPSAIPSFVCVQDDSARNAQGQVVPAFFEAAVGDEVNITEAIYDPATKTMSVKAWSGDKDVPPVLSMVDYGDLTSGAPDWLTPTMDAPPSKVRITSTHGGSAELQATTLFAPTTVDTTLPVAINDPVSFGEDATTQTIDVLVNDLNAAGGTVNLVSMPRLGTAAVAASGSSVTYTPSADATGLDSFTYTVTTATGTSNIGTVSVTLTGQNDPPVAVDDAFQVVAGVASVLSANLLANDTDPDGTADLIRVTELSPVTGTAGATISTLTDNGAVTFFAPSPGVYTFTYKAVDRALEKSVLPATVTVTAVGGDAVAVTTATFRADRARWAVDGTGSVTGSTITVAYTAPTPAGQPPATPVTVGTTTVLADGSWTLDVRGSSVTAVNGGTVTASSSAGGVSTPFAIRVR
jgi:hypothetical protein